MAQLKQTTMRTVHELTQKELTELRESLFSKLLDTDPERLGSIQYAHEIPMDDVKREYEGVNFSEDDFSCNL